MNVALHITKCRANSDDGLEAIAARNLQPGGRRLETVPCFQFDTTTQFIWEGDAIALRQGALYIAQGYLADWLSLFQGFDKAGGNEIQFKVSESLAGECRVEEQAVIIQDPSQTEHRLSVQQKDLQKLEDSLLELHQGCCGPVSFNFVADIIQEPDEILGLLQDVTSFKLSAQQVEAAKASIATLPTEYEIDVLDLFNLWEFSPDLAYFAKALRFYLLSA